MNEGIKEQLSALVDNELDELEEHRVLAALKGDPTLRNIWERYHLVRAALHQDLEVVVARDLAERVAQRIAAEPSAAAAFQRHHINRLIGTLAIAASVAAVAIVGVQWLQQPTPMPILKNLATNTPASTTAPVPVQVSLSGNARWDTKNPDAENALNAYLVEHGEFASTAGIGGMMPYVRAVSYDNDK
jgi:sigma-E factor negative regulatory protein RseA